MNTGLCGKYLPFNKILGFFSQKSMYSHLCLILRMKIANLYIFMNSNFFNF